jgi:cation diffusion facilitator CzcD-associated flavoprotein CzcO
MHTRLAIIGTGFSGIGAAVRLREEGIDDFVMLERASNVGGTWRDNRYPGCACDVPSRLYSFSFAQSSSWTHGYSGQAEILAYLERVADDRGLRPFIRFDESLVSAAWDGHADRWTLVTSRGTLTADAIVLATGPLSDPAIPAIPGLAEFTGRRFHSGDWDDGFDLRGKHVAVIGTGASAIQFVPRIQPLVASLSLYQRTPAWVVPRRNRRYLAAERALFAAVPPLQRLVRGTMYGARELSFIAFRYPSVARVLQRLALRHLQAQVPDAALRAKLTPSYTIGCKRILISNDFYPALSEPNVELVTDSIAGIMRDGVMTSDGNAHRADAIIFATGFRPTDSPLAGAITGRDGRTLADAWSPTMTAYASTTIAGFPNLFVIPGPNSGLGHTSLIYMIESQIAHMMGVLRHMRSASISAIEPRPEAQRRFVAHVDERMRGTVWTAGGCRSWYLDATGRNSTLWPDFTFRFRRALSSVRPEDYVSVSRN